MIKYIREKRITLDKNRFDLKAVYHDPCNYGRKAQKLFGQGFYDEPRWIMSQCLHTWQDLYPAREHQFCCGGGGGTMTTGYNLERLHYGRKKIQQLKDAGAEMIVVPCHSCHGQLNNLKEACDMPHLRVIYLWELVAECLVVQGRP